MRFSRKRKTCNIAPAATAKLNENNVMSILLDFSLLLKYKMYISRKPKIPKKMPNTNCTIIPANIFSPNNMKNKEIRYNNSKGKGSEIERSLFIAEGIKLSKNTMK
jgi:hypothetical protein